MAEPRKHHGSAFHLVCDRLLSDYPLAIGVAFKWLDCGCAQVCGVSARGEPVGRLTHVSGQPVDKRGHQPICLKCKRDGGQDRVVWQGIHWPGSKAEWPEKDLRLEIGRLVFGPGYSE